ncbi:uncharacterized protein LOC116777626 [Danaus plexippus]|uniref:Uncharacterized protein n=1 Tax=Danaus plexippus plexippus TaxID=278856 RepID=A0A212EXL8_DANPL|nr:uncharacterized protein LOC116777626 [Danaus plexippus]OWR46211.1 hypothetical protein KGM_200098 [Danaus plexippus plexippus]
MSLRILFVLAVATHLSVMIQADGGGGHKKVIIHVPLFVKHHHHKHTIVKHIHHKSGGGGGDDHYEVLGYTYGEPKAAPHFGGGHGWSAAEESHDSPVSFSGGDHASYSLSGDDYGGHGY